MKANFKKVPGTIKRVTRALEDKGIIARVGGKRFGKWVCVDDAKNDGEV